jgi:hypothetical protein
MRRAHVPPRRQEQRIRVSEALVGYPVYEIPEWDPGTKSLREAHLEYVRLFFAEKDRRLEALGRFLAKFDIDMSLDDTGAMAVSAWLPLYVDLLVDKLEDEGTQSAYDYLESAWTGPLLGLNTIFDLGIILENASCIAIRNCNGNLVEVQSRVTQLIDFWRTSSSL